MAAVVQQPSYKQIVLRLRELIKYFGSLTMAGPHDLARIAFDPSVNPYIKSVATKYYASVPMEYYSVVTHAHGEWQIPMFPFPVYVQSFDGTAQVTLTFPNSRLRDHVYTFDVANSRFVGAAPVFDPSLQTSTPVSGAAPPRFPDLSGMMYYWLLPSNHEFVVAGSFEGFGFSDSGGSSSGHSSGGEDNSILNRRIRSYSDSSDSCPAPSAPGGAAPAPAPGYTGPGCWTDPSKQ